MKITNTYVKRRKVNKITLELSDDELLKVLEKHGDNPTDTIEDVISRVINEEGTEKLFPLPDSKYFDSNLDTMCDIIGEIDTKLSEAIDDDDTDTVSAMRNAIKYILKSAITINRYFSTDRMSMVPRFENSDYVLKSLNSDLSKSEKIEYSYILMKEAFKSYSDAECGDEHSELHIEEAFKNFLLQCNAVPNRLTENDAKKDILTFIKTRVFGDMMPIESSPANMLMSLITSAQLGGGKLESISMPSYDNIIVFNEGAEQPTIYDDIYDALILLSKKYQQRGVILPLVMQRLLLDDKKAEDMCHKLNKCNKKDIKRAIELLKYIQKAINTNSTSDDEKKSTKFLKGFVKHITNYIYDLMDACNAAVPDHIGNKFLYELRPSDYHKWKDRHKYDRPYVYNR